MRGAECELLPSLPTLRAPLSDIATFREAMPRRDCTTDRMKLPVVGPDQYITAPNGFS